MTQAPKTGLSSILGAPCEAFVSATKPPRGGSCANFIRWWHASAAAMERTLSQASVPRNMLDLIKPIVETCSVCRLWEAPRPDAMSSIHVVDKFNHAVEGDLMFYSEHIIFHLVDKCIRWEAAVEIKDRECHTLLGAISVLWIAIHGAMGTLIFDGETGLQTDEAK